MITRVRQLTPMNVKALKEVGLAKTVGATYADFDGAPDRVADQLSELMLGYAFDSTTYRALHTVRRKLRSAATSPYPIAHQCAGVTALGPCTKKSLYLVIVRRGHPLRDDTKRACGLHLAQLVKYRLGNGEVVVRRDKTPKEVVIGNG